MQRYFGFSNVYYCRKRSTQGGLKASELPMELRHEISRHNALDLVVYAQAVRLLQRQCACFGVTAQVVARFREELRTWQRNSSIKGCANGTSALDGRLKSATTGNWSWRAPWCKD